MPVKVKFMETDSKIMEGFKMAQNNDIANIAKDEDLLDSLDDLMQDVMDGKNMSIDEAYNYIHIHLLSIYQGFKGEDQF